MIVGHPGMGRHVFKGITMRLSIVVPLYNEHENVAGLYAKVLSSVEPLGHAWELILVDDGSRDGTSEAIEKIAEKDARVIGIHFRRNYGQTAAMQAGFEAASGEVIITMDGDLQNDPADIGMMLERLNEGYDLVHGWRRDRHDALWSRKVPSRIANRIIQKVTGVPVQDLGCSLKVVRREVADELDLYGEMHRFIAVLAHGRGARVLEVPVRHHARQFGVSKYGLSRTTRVILDLITVKFLTAYLDRPMKLLGKAALICGAAGWLSLAATLGMKFFGGVDMTGNPLLLLSALLVMMSLQFMGLGLLGEMSTRMYYLRSGRRPFAVRQTRGLGLRSGSTPHVGNRAA